MGRGRKYVETSADDYVLVCRYVLAGDNRNSVYRYAQALRNASQFQLTSANLVDFLIARGGVRTLYTAEDPDKPGRTRVLHLSSWLQYANQGDFTLTLRHTGGGAFDVVQKGLAISEDSEVG